MQLAKVSRFLDITAQQITHVAGVEIAMNWEGLICLDQLGDR